MPFPVWVMTTFGDERSEMCDRNDDAIYSEIRTRLAKFRNKEETEWEYWRIDFNAGSKLLEKDKLPWGGEPSVLVTMDDEWYEPDYDEETDEYDHKLWVQKVQEIINKYVDKNMGHKMTLIWMK